MTTYTASVPANRNTTERQFTSLRKAKAYARTLKPGDGVDGQPTVFDDNFSGRFIRLIKGKFDYSSAPESWKN